MSQRYDAIAESQLGADGALPNWWDQLKPATYRGVLFHVDTVEWTAGDNVVVREYPFQDLPTIFRMGAAAQELKFSAYVIGNDYHLQRDALMQALQGPGDGILMHPTAGSMRVYVAGKFTVKENPSAEGGMARFDLHFVRADARRDYASSKPNTPAVATDKAAVTKAAVADDFKTKWEVKDKPSWVAKDAVDRVKESLSVVTKPIARAAASINGFSSDFNKNYRALVDGLDDLVAAPRQLADALVQLYALPTDLSNAAARDFQAAFAWGFNLGERLPKKPFEQRVIPAVGAGLVMYGAGSAQAARSGTPGQAQADALADASDLLFETLATAAYVQATAALDLGNYEDAMAMRGLVHTQLLRLMQDASAAPAPPAVPTSSLHDTLLVLHAAALADLQARGRDLVRLTTYTPQGWEPVWVISHRLYGTTAHADEILAMNPHIEHPLLVPPGRALRVMRHE